MKKLYDQLIDSNIKRKEEIRKLTAGKAESIASSIFWKKKHVYEKLGFSEIKQFEKFFFLFPMICTFDFCKNMSPLYILFLVDKYMTQIMSMCFENC